MLGIITKYHGATNTRGSRISATVQDGSWKKRVYVAYDHSLPATGDAVFRKAAEAMCDKLTAMGLFHSMTWSNPGNLVSGTISNGYVFVLMPPENQS